MIKSCGLNELVFHLHLSAIPAAVGIQGYFDMLQDKRINSVYLADTDPYTLVVHTCVVPDPCEMEHLLVQYVKEMFGLCYNRGVEVS